MNERPDHFRYPYRYEVLGPVFTFGLIAPFMSVDQPHLVLCRSAQLGVQRSSVIKS